VSHVLCLPRDEASRCLVVDKSEGDIQSWLSPPDSWKNYNIACDSRHTGTARWFLEGNVFSEWKVSGTSSLLWINGKRARSSSLSVFTETNSFPHYSGCWEERPLVRSTFHISVSVTYSVVQFVDHRGRRSYAEAGTCITCVLLL